MGTTAAARPPANSFQSQLVATKLHVPELRAGFVSRADLVARLVSGDRRKLTLVCAPAGWGKTILLSQWQAAPREQRPFAWVSLDPSDDDPVRFWAYVIGALRTVEPELGAPALAALPTAGHGLLEAVVAPLISELAASSSRLVLALDDYHVLHSEAIHASVAFLLRYLPRSLHLAVASRADPPLRLARLRAADELIEIRAAELRFSDAEANALLNDSLGLGLEQPDVELLQARTEGWAAGLQLAGLSLRGRDDKRAFLDAFAGDDRQIGEYLNEVLADQAAPLRDFLLRTSILERLCAPLCDAVTGAGDAVEQLEAVERSNLFLVPLDTRRRWSRYHHLFRDLLRHELERAEPELALELHRRASAWYRSRGDIDQAIAHATAAGDFGDAAGLIAGHWRLVFNAGQAETVVRWIAGLPHDDVLADARLCLAQASLMLYLGRLDEAGTWLRNAERAHLPGPLDDGMTSAEGSAALLLASHAYLSGDVGQAIEASRRAVSLHPDETDPGRAIGNVTLGLGRYYAGEGSAAAAALGEALGQLSSDGWPFPIAAALGGLAMVYADDHDPARAERVATEAERLIGEAGFGSPGTALTLAARGKLLELQGDLAAADVAFGRAVVLARQGRRLDLAHALILLARLKRRRRDYAGARALAREGRAVLASCPDPGILRKLLAQTERSLQLASTPPSAPVLAVDLDLTERELTVLRLLAGELSQREIGSELYVSFNTIKGHVRSIFRKLRVQSRATAVSRGRELGLL